MEISPERFNISQNVRKLKDIVHYLDSFSDDPEKIEVANFFRANQWNAIPYDFAWTHAPPKDIEVHDTSEGKYVLFEGKKLFFPRTMANAAIQDAYSALLTEQAKESPHCYSLRARYMPDNGDVVADLGAAEGIWALSVIERCSRAYLFECEPMWIEALQHTFAPWRGKVVIVNKFVGGVDDDDFVTLDTYFRGKRIDCVKADIEGAEVNMLQGGAHTFSKKISKAILCSYHRQDDERNIEELLREYGFGDVTPSGRYMFFLIDRLDPPYLRRALVRGYRNDKWDRLDEVGRSPVDFLTNNKMQCIGLLAQAKDAIAANRLIAELERRNIDYVAISEQHDAERRFDCVVSVADACEPQTMRSLSEKYEAEIVPLEDMIAIEYDKTFLFSRLANILGDLRSRAYVLGWANYSDLRLDGEAEKLFSRAYIRTNPDKFMHLYSEIDDSSYGFIKELFSERPLRRNGPLVGHDDRQGKFVNIGHGLRKTDNQPQRCDMTIHVFGGSIAFGTGADDSRTFASCLQTHVDSLNEPGAWTCRVENRGLDLSDTDIEEKTASLDLFAEQLENVTVGPNDLVVHFLRPGFHSKKARRQKKSLAYIAAGIDALGLGYIDLAPTLTRLEEKKGVYINNEYINHRGYEGIASVAYHDAIKARLRRG